MKTPALLFALALLPARQDAVLLPAPFPDAPIHGRMFSTVLRQAPPAVAPAPPTPRPVDAKVLEPFKAALDGTDDKSRAWAREVQILYRDAGSDPTVARAQAALTAAINAFITNAIETTPPRKAERDAFVAWVTDTNRKIVIAAGGNPDTEDFDRTSRMLVPKAPAAQAVSAPPVKPPAK